MSDREADVTALYEALRGVARAYFRRERTGHTLQPTALVNEALARLLSDETFHWESREHLAATAARQMRRILVEFARRRRSAKRGGSQAVSLDALAPDEEPAAGNGWTGAIGLGGAGVRGTVGRGGEGPPGERAQSQGPGLRGEPLGAGGGHPGVAGRDPAEPIVDVLHLHDVLDRLRRVSAVQEQIVELRFFGGMSGVEIATALALPPAQVEREWRFARAWLSRHLAEEAP